MLACFEFCFKANFYRFPFLVFFLAKAQAMHLFAAMSLQMEPFKKIAPWTSNFSFPLLPLSRKSAKFPVFCKSRPSINQMLQKWSIFAVFRKYLFFALLLNHFDRIKSC